MFINKQFQHLAPAWGLMVTLAITLPAQATIFEDFLFDDPAGTTIANAANSANPGNQFDVNTDTIAVVTNGSGQLNASLKNNVGFGTNFVDTAGFTTGKLYGVMELTWNFQSVLDTTENEEIRITLESADPTSTALAAEFRITRSDNDDVTIEGRSGPGGTNTTPVTLNGGSLAQSAKFIAVVAADLTAESYEILYSSDAGGSFLSAGIGNIVPGRGVEAIRMALNNDLINDNILIDRVYLTDISPVTSVEALTLVVDPVTGNMEIKNNTTTSFDIDSYRIATVAAQITFQYRDASTGAISEGIVEYVSTPLAGDFDIDLDVDAWSSLSDKATDAVDGPDPGSTVGNGVGETWDEAAGSDADVLAESFLLGSSVFGPGRTIALGRAYDPDVDGADFLAWQRDQSPSPLSPADLVAWQANYGSGSGSLGAVTIVPEPNTCGLAALAAMIAIGRGCKPKQ